MKRLNGICAQVLPYLSKEVTTQSASKSPFEFSLLPADSCLCVLASAAGHGCHRERQAGHAPRHELHYTGERAFHVGLEQRGDNSAKVKSHNLYSAHLYCIWLQQQLQVQHLSQLQGLALPVTPLPLGLTPPSLPAVSSSSGLLSLSSIMANYSHGQAQVVKEDKARDAAERVPRGEDGDKSD